MGDSPDFANEVVEEYVLKNHGRGIRVMGRTGWPDRHLTDQLDFHSPPPG
jgi:hypothetical protein